MNKTVLAAIIGAGATITAAVIGVYAGRAYEQNIVQNQIEEVLGNNVNVVGDGNNVVINDATTLAHEYMEIQSDYDELQSQNNYLVGENTNLSSELDILNQEIKENQTESNKEIEDLKAQINNFPVVDFKNLALCIDVDDVSINTNKSAVSIDGRDYFSREIVENLVPNDKNLTIKEGTIFIGKVISEKANLFDQHCLDKNGINLIDTITDSYGNNYSNVLYASIGNTSTKYIIYTLDRKYSLLKLSVAIRDNAKLSSTGILTIKADDQVVYTSEKLDKTTEPFSISDIPIDNCSRLTIEYAPSYYNIDCIIFDAVVYN